MMRGRRSSSCPAMALYTPPVSYEASAEADATGRSICLSRAGTREASRALLLVNSDAMMCPVLASTATCSLRQSLCLVGFRRLPTWILTPVLSIRMWTGRPVAGVGTRILPSFLARLESVVWSGLGTPRLRRPSSYARQFRTRYGFYVCLYWLRFG